MAGHDEYKDGPVYWSNVLEDIWKWSSCDMCRCEQNLFWYVYEKEGCDAVELVDAALGGELAGFLVTIAWQVQWTQSGPQYAFQPHQPPLRAPMVVRGLWPNKYNSGRWHAACIKPGKIGSSPSHDT